MKRRGAAGAGRKTKTEFGIVFNKKNLSITTTVAHKLNSKSFKQMSKSMDFAKPMNTNNKKTSKSRLSNSVSPQRLLPVITPTTKRRRRNSGNYESRRLDGRLNSFDQMLSRMHPSVSEDTAGQVKFNKVWRDNSKNYEIALKQMMKDNMGSYIAMCREKLEKQNPAFSNLPDIQRRNIVVGLNKKVKHSYTNPLADDVSPTATSCSPSLAPLSNKSKSKNGRSSTETEILKELESIQRNITDKPRKSSSVNKFYREHLLELSEAPKPQPLQFEPVNTAQFHLEGVKEISPSVSSAFSSPRDSEWSSSEYSTEDGLCL